MIEFTTPPGTKDTIGLECKTLRELEIQFRDRFDRWGYEEVITPMIEYYQTFTAAQMKDREMYKMLDASNRILTLRADMTVPIARLAATKLKDSPLPLRFQYSASVFKLQEHFSGNQNEGIDCGVELLGVDESSGDLEILACALDALSVLKDQRYTLEIGNRKFFLAACEALHLTETTVNTLADLINRKSITALQDYIAKLDLNEDKKDFFRQLPWLCGDVSILKQARSYAFDSKLITILDELEQYYHQCEQLGYGEHISFDLGKIPRMQYYSGIIFEAFVEGVGNSVLSGGRYDHLCERFGRALTAIGFAIRLDAFAKEIKKKQVRKNIILTYPPHLQVEALKQAADLRQENIVVLRADASLTHIMIKEGVESC